MVASVALCGGGLLSGCFGCAWPALAAMADGLIAPDDVANGHRLTFYGPWTQAKRFEPLAKVHKLLKDACVWLAGVGLSQ